MTKGKTAIDGLSGSGNGWREASIAPDETIFGLSALGIVIFLGMRSRARFKSAVSAVTAVACASLACRRRTALQAGFLDGSKQVTDHPIDDALRADYVSAGAAMRNAAHAVGRKGALPASLFGWWAVRSLMADDGEIRLARTADGGLFELTLAFRSPSWASDAMAINRPVVTGSTSVSSTTLSDSVRWRIFLYLGVLIVLMDFGSPLGGLINVPISFFLKNKLHLEAQESSEFKLISAIPVYLSFLFGFARDTWNPFGMRDRGFLVLFGATGAGVCVFFAFSPLTYEMLILAVLLLTTSFLFISAARNGLSSTIGQQHLMSGQISAVWNIFASLVVVIALLIGGPLSDLLEERNADQAGRLLFLVAAIIMASVAVYGVWKPRSVFENVHAEHQAGTRTLEDIKKLLGHWPIYPSMLVWLLWNFAPGSDTPLQYYLQNTLGARDAEWGAWNAIFGASFIPTFIGFGLLCRKYPLKTLLWWGTIIAVPQMVPLLLIASMNGAYLAAVVSGLMGGVATAAYFDLIIRSCPRGLQGTTVMIAVSLAAIAVRFGDRLGASLYDHFGSFTVCVIATTVVYALILPALLLVPRQLIATWDGEAPGCQSATVRSNAGRRHAEDR